MKHTEQIDEERSWSFGPGGSDTSNWMSADTRRDRPRITVGRRGDDDKPSGRSRGSDPQLLKAEFKDKFPSIPKVSDIDGGFSNSVHQKAERVGRDEAIDAYAGGNGNKFLAVYWANRGNPNGTEYHWITDNGIVIVTNADKNNGRLIVTKLIARPGQLTRYPNNRLYGDPHHKLKDQLVDAIQVYPSSGGWRVPRDVMDIARLHQELGLNYMEESIMDSLKEIGGKIKKGWNDFWKEPETCQVTDSNGQKCKGSVWRYKPDENYCEIVISKS